VDTVGNVRSDLKLRGSGRDSWDVIKVSESSVACTLPYQRKFVLLEVTNDNLRVDKEIRVDGECRGIDIKNGQFVVSFGRPNKIELIDADGNVLRKIELSEREFSDPYYVRFSRDGQSFYISDWGKNQVTMLKLDGKVQANYYESDFQAYNMFVDEQGYLYVCDKQNNNIRILLPDLKNAKTILPRGRGPNKTMCVAVSAVKNSVFVAGIYPYIYQYQLS